MKISKETFTVLKSCSAINKGLVVDEPNVIKTMSNSGSIICLFDTEETYPVFAVWDLTKLNSLIDVLGIENCEFDFNEKESYIEVSYGSRKFKYEFADVGTMPVFEKMKDSKTYKAFDKFDFKFVITEQDIKDIKKANNIFGFSEDVLEITMKDDIGTIRIFSENNETTNDFEIEISGEGSGTVMTKVEDLCMIDTDYEASVSEQMIKYQASDMPLIYFIRTYLEQK